MISGARDASGQHDLAKIEVTLHPGTKLEGMMTPRTGFGVAAIAGVLTFASAPVSALEEAKDEKDKIKACEVTLCSLVTKKAPNNGDFACALSKTWTRDKIKEGSASGRVSWGFGDARCSVDLKVPRAAIVAALQSPKGELQIPEHTVHCDVEQEKKDVKPVKLKLAPKLTFKDGKAVTALVNLKEVDGPGSIRGLAFTMAKLEDSLGIFHKSMLKAINKQLHEKCPAVAAGG